jgi:drug/metabolite transporter (DMT)-like permease
MDLYVFLAVLVAAACHAGWNTLLKLDLEPLTATVLMVCASGVLSLPIALYLGLPASASWPYLAASVAIHVGYFLSLATAYKAGDMGQVYPIARGAAPLMTAVLATLLLGESPGGYGWAGIALLASGIVLLAVRGGRVAKTFDARSVGFSLLTSLTITVYTIVDGSGARISGDPVAYTLWLFVLSSIVVGSYGYVRIGPTLLAAARTHWPITAMGSALSVAAYVIAIWAMTVAPIALVAALRETSVLFGALFATLILREPWIAARVVSAVMVLAGALLLRMR